MVVTERWGLECLFNEEIIEKGTVLIKNRAGPIYLIVEGQNVNRTSG